MKLKILFVVGIMVLLFSPYTVIATGFAVGPPSLKLQVTADEENTTIIYITSYDYNGDILVGTGGLFFDVYPEVIHLNDTDENRRIELRIHGNRSLANDVYSGSLTFLGSTDENVAAGVKIGINVTQVGSSTTEDLLEILRVNYLVILVTMLVIASLIVGILIGGRRR